MPRKLSAVSPMIMAGTASVAVVMVWLRKFGSMWRRITRIRRAPMRRAATTNSSTRSARKRPRTCRARIVQPNSERMMVTPK